MNINNNSRADQWLQHYEQDQIQEIYPCFSAINMPSSLGSSLVDGGGAVAQEASGRRSRASRRAIPTTLLNANPSNFRALVQKFTGRSAGGESNRRKGPVTLDFGCPTKISKEAIFPVSHDTSNYDHDHDHDHVLNQHVSYEQPHVTWSGTEATTSYQLGEEISSAIYGGGYDDQDQDQDLLREYFGNSSYDDGLDHMDCYHDFHRDTAPLEEFMMRDLDL